MTNPTKETYVRVKDAKGNEFICSLDALKDIKKATDEEGREVIEVGRDRRGIVEHHGTASPTRPRRRYGGGAGRPVASPRASAEVAHAGPDLRPGPKQVPTQEDALVLLRLLVLGPDLPDQPGLGGDRLGAQRHTALPGFTPYPDLTPILPASFS